MPRLIASAFAVSLVCGGGPATAATPVTADPTCTVVRILPSGRRIVKPSTAAPLRPLQPGRAAAASASGAASSAVSVSSWSGGGGHATASSSTSSGGRTRTVTTTHDESGCTVVIDERRRRGARR